MSGSCVVRQNEYGGYLTFLQNSDELSDHEWHIQNGLHIHKILQHVASWKSFRHYPTSHEIAELCKMKELPNEPQLGKLHLMRQLIPAILIEIKSLATEYVPPTGETDIGRELMQPVNAPVNSPVPQRKRRTRDDLPTVGVVTFDNTSEYELFKVIGKHPVHASPCVDISSIDWTHPLVYEEWNRRDTKGNKISYRCRRYGCRRIRPGTQPAIAGQQTRKKKKGGEKSGAKKGCQTNKKPKTTLANGLNCCVSPSLNYHVSIIKLSFAINYHAPIIDLSLTYHILTTVMLSLSFPNCCFYEKMFIPKNTIINLSLNYHQDIIKLSFSCHHFERVGK